MFDIAKHTGKTTKRHCVTIFERKKMSEDEINRSSSMSTVADASMLSTSP